MRSPHRFGSFLWHQTHQVLGRSSQFLRNCSSLPPPRTQGLLLGLVQESDQSSRSSVQESFQESYFRLAFQSAKAWVRMLVEQSAEAWVLVLALVWGLLLGQVKGHSDSNTS